jgi:hypothetical protein
MLQDNDIASHNPATNDAMTIPHASPWSSPRYMCLTMPSMPGAPVSR